MWSLRGGALGVAACARYLGLMLGPGRGETSWVEPFKKYLARAVRWGKLGAGACLTARAYQVYVASVLLFVGQLEPLPATFAKLEVQACSALFPGPTGWITAGCLKDQEALGLQWKLGDVQASALAAKARVTRFEAQGELHVHSRAKRLEGLDSIAGGLSRLGWLERWRPRCFLSQLAAADREVAQLIRASPTADLRLEVRSGWQRRITTLCRPPSGAAALHLRRRLDRWDIKTLPGHRPARALRHIALLAGRCHPRVLAAYMRTICNGWCTRHRFQGVAGCPFGCAGGKDKLEHFACCPVVRGLLHDFQLPAPLAGEELDVFLGLQALPLVAGGDPEAQARRLGVARYALYRLHGALRHQTVGVPHLPGAFREYARQGFGAEQLFDD